ncbi:hypothetical protein pb186bvf_004603 [Paramecium bursaria]
MKKLSILNIKPLSNLQSPDKSKKVSTLDISSPFSSIHSKRVVNQPISSRYATSKKESIYMKSPQSTKASQGNENNRSLAQNMFKDEQIQGLKQMASSRRITYNQFSNQLKNILGSKKKAKQSPDFQLSQRLPSNSNQHLKTSPDTRQDTIQRQKSLNASERLMKIEQTRQKIMALQIQIQGNIQQRKKQEEFQVFDIKQHFKSRPPLPQSSQNVVKYYVDDLTTFEKGEVLEYETIFYLGNIHCKQREQTEPLYNYGFDNQGGDYKYVKGDHIAYRYEMIDKLGHGSFGYVFKVIDHKYNQQVALKIIKNKEKFHNQALIEIDILKVVNKADGAQCLIKMMGYFVFRNHICMVFELLSVNLYEFIALNDFNGFNMDLIRRFAIQILQALLYLKATNIIHCDLKPENILLKDMNKSGIKIIDFGSSCFIDQKLYTYIQSRFYRAPEIVLGYPYTTQIDMWSFGCIVAELFTGHSLFQSKSEKELLYLQTKILGRPDKDYIKMSPRKDRFYDNNYQLSYKISDVDLLLQIKPLNNMLNQSPAQFQDFVTKCLQWNPNDRLTPEGALVHPWILEGLPPQIKQQNKNQINFKDLPFSLCRKSRLR